MERSDSTNIMKWKTWKSMLRYLFRCLLDFFTDLLFGLAYRNGHVPLPPINNPLLLESAVSLARKIRSGKVKSEDAVKAYIARIADVNKTLNAVVDTRFAEAIQEAREVDKLIASGEKSEEQLMRDTPFLGVPFTVKDNFAAKGLHQVAGAVSRKNFVSEVDAPAIALMKKSGAILLAVTNTSEMCMAWESNNKAHGRTSNPYNTTRISGGSSGGEGSGIAAAASVIGIGSDIAGSIRMPCFFNGIFGHKPSKNVVPWQGQIPPCLGEHPNYIVAGPMCRYASDLMPMFKVLCQEKADMLKLDQPVDIKKLKIFYMEDDGGNPTISTVHPELKAAMRKVVVHFEKAYGITAQKVYIREFVNALPIWFVLMFAGGEKTFAELLADGRGKVNGYVELIKWFLGLSNYTFSSIMLCITETVNPDPGLVRAMQAKCDGLREHLNELLGEDGVFLFPSHPRPAPYHGQPLFQFFNFVYTGVFNVLGLPATQCPLGLGKEGLPLGIQVVGKLNNDHLPLAVALELESAFGGWVSPSPVP